MSDESIFKTCSDIPRQYQIDPVEQNYYLINGKMECWNGEMQEVLSPVCLPDNGALKRVSIGHYPLMTEKETCQALEAAGAAYDKGRGKWPTMSVAQRIDCVQDFACRMKKKRSAVVKLLMWEIGKTLKDSEKEFDRTVEYIADTVDALKELDRVSSRFTIKDGIFGQIRRSPLGVVLCMGPYNYPLNETFTTLIPALIMGNTVIFKPPKYGVLLHSPLLEAFQQSFPAGVVNTVYGPGRKITPPLMSSGRIDVLAFIGSSKAADTLKGKHPKPHRLRSILGLDAKNAGIILEDADMDLAVKECILGALSFNGQRCTALKILFVHRSIADKFAARMGEAVAALKCGLPWEDGVSITPLPEEGKPAYLEDLVKDAVACGAKVMCCGSREETLFRPTVLYGVTEKAKIYREEQFGPIIPIVPFDDIEEPVRYVVESQYGQQVSVFGTGPDQIASLVDPLVNQVCRVNINSQCQRGPDTFPFTGRKDSAEGTLSVSDALRCFSIRTLVAAKESDENKAIVNDIVRGHKSNFLSTDFIL